MTIIQWLSEVMGNMGGWFRPVRHEFMPVSREQRTDGRTRMAFYAASIACAMIVSVIPLTAWTADLPSPDPVKPRTVVAAGVGYENAETSTITVKTYDAESGEILSEETYDLNVREDMASAGSQPSERIFAGGVGPGVDGLSVFTLRVYDAATGQFLWEGFLNLTAGDQESGSTHRVAAHLVARQATVIRVNDRGAIDGQPQFFLRAVDAVTGQLVWSDHFSAEAGRLARTEHVNRAIVGQTEELTAPSQQIEFRIRMTDNRGRQILWEDTIEPAIEETDVVAGHDDAAEILPAWNGAELEEVKEEAI
ncbi:MAG TPA: hypothetical protein VLL94_15545 [Nitrospiraceae bacterium]|nr:hypothetical protein [Nitrospiraceae bacterium]